MCHSGLNGTSAGRSAFRAFEERQQHGGEGIGLLWHHEVPGILDHAKSERPDWPDRDAPHVVAPELATECQLAVVQFDRPDWLTQPLAPDGVLVHRQSIGVLQGLDEVVLTL
jgi:hypothetical protein